MIRFWFNGIILGMPYILRILNLTSLTYELVFITNNHMVYLKKKSILELWNYSRVWILEDHCILKAYAEIQWYPGNVTRSTVHLNERTIKRPMFIKPFFLSQEQCFNVLNGVGIKTGRDRGDERIILLQDVLLWKHLSQQLQENR